MIYMEHKELWGLEGVVDSTLEVPLGQARTLCSGSDLTIVTWSRGVAPVMQALQLPELQGVGVEVIDLRALWPWDKQAVFDSAARSGRQLVVHEAVQVAGFGAEVAASAAEATGCRIKRLGAPRIPVGYAQVLENEARLSPEKVALAARSLLDA